MSDAPEFFRKALKEFRTADAVLTDQLKQIEGEATAKLLETTKKIETAENIASTYGQRIKEKGLPISDFQPTHTSPQIESALQTLKERTADVQKDEQELDRLRSQSLTLHQQLDATLLEEGRQQRFLERQRHIANVRRVIGAVAFVCLAVALHFWLLGRTTLSFEISLDGKPLPTDKKPKATLDGKPFVSGAKFKPGRHQISVELENFEPFQQAFWAFYGKKDFGMLPLESSKGSLSVTVKPSSVEIVLQRDGSEICRTNAPLRMEKLAVGNYSLLIRRGQYEERGSVIIERQRLTETNIILNLGSIHLSSEPPDSQFELSGPNLLHWEGKLPVSIEDVPAGSYRFVANKKGWELEANVIVNRDQATTNHIEFPYGSIELTSDPTGLAVSTNGMEIGKTPLTLSELKPGQYDFAVTDGENDLTAHVDVGQKEKVKHAFVFKYGAVRLVSSPSGATIIRKGKSVGQTPLTLQRLPAGETAIELQLNGYVSTNILMRAVEGATIDSTTKLISERYLQAMKQARETFEAGQFAAAQKSIDTALESEPTDPTALKLRDEVSQAIAKAEEASRAEQANAKAQALAALPRLDFSKVIEECSDTKVVQNPVVMNDGYYDKDGKFIVTGQRTVMKNNTTSTFNDVRFASKYIGKTYKFDSAGWKIAKIEKDGTIVFRTSGSRNSLELGQDEIRAIPSAANQGEFLSVKDNQRITIKARIKSHDRGDFLSRVLQRIHLEDAQILEK